MKKGLSLIMLRILLPIFIFLICANVVYGKSSFGSNYGLGVVGGARAEALGGAFVAVADDPGAIFYNPAGLASYGIEGSYITTGLAIMSQERYSGYISYIDVPSEKQKWGFGVAFAGTGYKGIKGYDIGGVSTGSPIYYDTITYFSVARRLDSEGKFSLGFNFKLLHRSIDGNPSIGGGLDIGLKVSVSIFDFGIFVGDVITGEKFLKTGGVSYHDRRLKISVATNISSIFMISFQLDKNLSTKDKIIYRLGSYIRLFGGERDFSEDKKKGSNGGVQRGKGGKVKSALEEDELRGDKGEDLSKEFGMAGRLKDSLYLNVGYGGYRVGLGLTLIIWRMGFDFSVSFKELSLRSTRFLFNINFLIY